MRRLNLLDELRNALKQIKLVEAQRQRELQEVKSYRQRLETALFLLEEQLLFACECGKHGEAAKDCADCGGTGSLKPIRLEALLPSSARDR